MANAVDEKVTLELDIVEVEMLVDMVQAKMKEYTKAECKELGLTSLFEKLDEA